MRILAAHPGPQFSVADVYAGWVEALRGLGVQVVEYNLAERLTFYDSALLEVDKHTLRKALSREQATELAVNGLYAALYKTRPDVLLIVSGFFYPTELLETARSYGTRVVIVHTETPYEDGRQLKLAPHADWNLVNDPVTIERFAALAPTRYVPHAYRPSVHCPGDAQADLVADLAFVGTGYASRIAFFEAMNFGNADVLLAGNWQQLHKESALNKHVAHDREECLDNADAVRIYRSAKVGINLYRRESEKADTPQGLAMGPREVEMAACGLFFIRDPRPEGDSVLSMLPTFTSPGEASELLAWWLAHDTERTRAAEQARRAVADRTFDAHAAALLRLLDK